MEISKDTKFTLSTETLVTVGVTLVTITGFYFSLKASSDDTCKVRFDRVYMKKSSTTLTL